MLCKNGMNGERVRSLAEYLAERPDRIKELGVPLPGGYNRQPNTGEHENAGGHLLPSQFQL
jgi:hypothetical protein